MTRESLPSERLTFEDCPIITLCVRLSVHSQLKKMAAALKPLEVF